MKNHLYVLILLIFANSTYAQDSISTIKGLTEYNKKLINIAEDELSGKYGESKLQELDKQNLEKTILLLKKFDKEGENFYIKISKFDKLLTGEKELQNLIFDLRKKEEKIDKVMIEAAQIGDMEKAIEADGKLSGIRKEIRSLKEKLYIVKDKNKSIHQELKNLKEEQKYWSYDLRKHVLYATKLINTSQNGYRELSEEEIQELYKEKFEKYRARGKPGNQIMIPCHAKENCQALPGVKANADYECPNGWVMLPRDHHQLIGNYVTIECR